MTDKRTNPRLGPLVIKAQVETEGETRQGYLTNISHGGAFVAMDHPPNAQQQVEIVAPFPWQLGTLMVVAEVVWTNPNATSDGRIAGAGVKFTSFKENSESVLVGYLERFTELAAQLEESTSDEQAH